MFGTVLTLKGVQEKNIFTADNGRQYKLFGSWVCPPVKLHCYIQLIKKDDLSWIPIRCLRI